MLPYGCLDLILASRTGIGGISMSKHQYSCEPPQQEASVLLSMALLVSVYSAAGQEIWNCPKAVFLLDQVLQYSPYYPNIDSLSKKRCKKKEKNPINSHQNRCYAGMNRDNCSSFKYREAHHFKSGASASHLILKTLASDRFYSSTVFLQRVEPVYDKIGQDRLNRNKHLTFSGAQIFE